MHDLEKHLHALISSRSLSRIFKKHFCSSRLKAESIWTDHPYFIIFKGSGEPFNWKRSIYVQYTRPYKKQSTEHVASIRKAFALVSSVSFQVMLDQSDCSQSPDQTWRSSSYCAPQNKLQKQTCVVLTLLYLEMQVKNLVLQQLWLSL